MTVNVCKVSRKRQTQRVGAYLLEQCVELLDDGGLLGLLRHDGHQFSCRDAHCSVAEGPEGQRKSVQVR